MQARPVPSPCTSGASPVRRSGKGWGDAGQRAAHRLALSVRPPPPPAPVITVVAAWIRPIPRPARAGETSHRPADSVGTCRTDCRPSAAHEWFGTPGSRRHAILVEDAFVARSVGPRAVLARTVLAHIVRTHKAGAYTVRARDAIDDAVIERDAHGIEWHVGAGVGTATRIPAADLVAAPLVRAMG